MIVKMYYAILFVSLCIVVLGLYGVVNGEQVTKLIGAAILAIQATDKIIKEKDKENGNNEKSDK